MESLFEKLKAYGESEYYPYHMPGHKRNSFGDMPAAIAGIDITEVDGFDNLHQPEELFASLQEKVSRIYGAEESFYLINGSTGGILSAISAALPESGHILMARNCHKSAYHAAYLRNLTISYLYPSVLRDYDICEAIAPQQVSEALEREPDMGAVLIVSPTYEGRIADIHSIAAIVHERGIPLIVDEAHGAHLGLAEGFAQNSCQAGADLVIHSVHKTLPAMTQTALLHVNGNLIDRDRLKRFLRIYQSSSPSYVLMAGIDNAVRVIEREGKTLFADFRSGYSHMLQLLENCKYFRFLPMEPGQDVGKLVIATGKSGLSGQAVYDILRREYRLQLEMASLRYCLAMFTVGDGPEAYGRMTEALLSLDHRIETGEILPEQNNAGEMFTDIAIDQLAKNGTSVGKSAVIPFAKAWDMETEERLLEDAVGGCTGEFVNLYPPGVPLLVPGERFTEGHRLQILEYVRQGLTVQGVRRMPAQPSKYGIKIIKI